LNDDDDDDDDAPAAKKPTSAAVKAVQVVKKAESSDSWRHNMQDTILKVLSACIRILEYENLESLYSS
jgi:hypothetical protein